MTTDSTQQPPATTANGTLPAQPAAPAPIVRQAPPPPPDEGGAIDVFASQANFASAQRMAKALASSSLVPAAYQGEGGLANVLIAMELAARIGASVFAVMQNIDIIHGRPSWRATFLIATVNACGRFTPLRFRFEGKPGTAEYGCRAVAKDKSDGEELVGALITLGLATSEGWATKSGSKWKTMPEQMLMYRSAAFWTRAYAPELALGMQTSDEARDVYGADVGELPAGLVPGGPQALKAALLADDKPIVTVAAVPAAPASEPKVAEVKAEPAKSEAKPRGRRQQPAEERDPVTNEVVPPPREEGDRGDDPNNW